MVHPVADTEPTVTSPQLSFPRIDGVVPQDDRVGAVDEAVICPLPCTPKK